MAETIKYNVYLPADAYETLMEFQKMAGLSSPAEAFQKLLKLYRQEERKSKKYCITSERWDVPRGIIATFAASSDQEALATLEDYKRSPGHAWNRLTLYRIDQEEKNTMLGAIGG